MPNLSRRKFMHASAAAFGMGLLWSPHGNVVHAKTNSQALLSRRLYLGDIDGNQSAELIEVDGRHIYIFRCDFDHTPVLEHVMSSPVKRLVIGDFVTSGREKGKEQILALLEDGSLQGWAISDDLTEMWWWFTQGSFINDTEHFIVGDFDGSGADDIMVYDPSTGNVKLYELKSSGFFEEMSGYSLGNLEGWDLKNKLILAGDFGQASPRTDILVIDRAVGQLSRFDTATETDGTSTFWWAFTAKPYLFGSADELVVANVDGGVRDSLIVRSSETGQYRLLQLEYNDGNLKEHTDIDVGQLPIRPGRGRIAAAKVREAALQQEPGVERDDIVLFDDDACEIIRTDARFDAGQNRFTYWWAYTSSLVVEPIRVPERKPWSVLLCRFKGLPGDPAIENFFREVFSPGTGGLIEYWHDVSLGAIDISDSRVFGWIELDLERANAGIEKIDRNGLIDLAIAAAQRDGIDPITNFHSQIAVFTHDFAVDGAPPGADWSDPVWGPYWIDGSAGNFGRVSAPPHGHSGTFLAHEMGHGFGFGHDLAADLSTHYGDVYCIMSAMGVWSFNHPRWNVPFGPAMSFPQLAGKNWTLQRRVLVADSSWTNTTTGISFTLAPMNDRRINASIGAILHVDASGGGWDYYLEYQRAIGWNRAIPPRLVIRRRIGDTAAYLGEVVVPTDLGGKAAWIEPSGQVMFEVEKIRHDERIINVAVSRVASKMHLPLIENQVD